MAKPDAKQRRDRSVPGKVKQESLSEPDRRTLSLLFMDLHGWSGLDPRSVSDYVRIALPEMTRLLKKGDAKRTNTWGDAIVATFDSSVRAAETALAIRDFFRQPRQSRGTAPGLSPRTALHLGEVIVYSNPITRREDIAGEAVNWCARLEPVTSPGEVFCTERFADVLTSEGAAAGIVALPLERRALAKNAGEELVHVVVGAGERDPRPLLAAPTDATKPITGALNATLEGVRLMATATTAMTPQQYAGRVEFYWIGIGPNIWVNPERTPGIDSITFHVANQLMFDVKLDALDIELTANNHSFLNQHRTVREVIKAGTMGEVRLTGFDFSQQAAVKFQRLQGDSVILNATVKAFLSAEYGEDRARVEFEKHSRMATWVHITKRLHTI